MVNIKYITGYSFPFFRLLRNNSNTMPKNKYDSDIINVNVPKLPYLFNVANKNKTFLVRIIYIYVLKERDQQLELLRSNFMNVFRVFPPRFSHSIVPFPAIEATSFDRFQWFPPHKHNQFYGILWSISGKKYISPERNLHHVFVQ